MLEDIIGWIALLLLTLALIWIVISGGKPPQAQDVGNCLDNACMIAED